ncbi:D-glycero-beta-D-manno-heptose 1-phosphate adenylyltransferase [Roseivirga sp. BDSF3-8]|uniref:D-glycero-beta-D-manno-heptose 1-phosphate adenylyltransferase n=1 Tax=Roseivirga sp. BDSF3-8 TaxID=3241598 RepID=UPI003531A3EC
MKTYTSGKIYSLSQAAKQVNKWKASGEKVVFTNGCFDIIHLGHVEYLEKAARQGDRLVVGVNTDASVSRLKGPSRPITDEVSRSRIIASLAFVDAVVLFSDPTPLALIEALIPDVLIKGNDYSVDNIVGADFVMKMGGNVATIKLVSGYSTTNIVKKIKESAPD